MEPDERAVDFDGFWKAALDLYVRPLLAFAAPAVEARLVEKTRLARLLLLETRFSRKNKRALYRLLTSLMRLPENLEREFDASVRSLEGPVGLILSPMELRAKEEGRGEGREEGRIAEARDRVIRALVTRFGAAPSRDAELAVTLSKVSEAAMLDALFDAAVLSASRDEFDAVVGRVLAR